MPVSVAEKLIADETPLKPTRSHGTALVMDILGFTAFSARHSPEKVVETLDAFFADASRVVSKQNGVVLSYLGDGLLATFNTPVSVAEPEVAAIRAARALLPVAKQHGFGVRIGIASGDLVTGIIGNETRQSFTVYGDAVNLASRLEAACKDLERTILIDQTNQQAATTETLIALGGMPILGLSNEIAVFAANVG